MDGWMGGWMDGWVGGWRDGGMDGWMEGWMAHESSLGVNKYQLNSDNSHSSPGREVG